MASKVTENSVEGDILIIKELSKHLQYTPEKMKMMIEESYHGTIAVESLLERAIATVGKLQRSNEDGQDFIDGSDAKKATVTINDAKTGDRAVRIENVANKNGILRVMIAEPMTGELFYFKIPNHEIKGKSNIKIAFSRTGGIQEKIINKIETYKFLKESIGGNIKFNPKFFNERAWLFYRVDSFEELCS